MAALPKEKADAYASQCEKREAFERQAAVENLVNTIDEKLTLTPDQYRKICAALVAHWNDRWSPQLESFAIQSSFKPSLSELPPELVSPELTEAQRKLFDELRSGPIQTVFIGGGPNREFGLIDDIKLDENAPQASDVVK